MLALVIAIHVTISFFLVLVVLLQQGQGADLSVFGGGNTQTAFGARSAANILHKLTVTGFVLFLMTTMAIGFLQSSGSGSSVMSGVAEPAAETVLDEVPAPPELGALEAEAAVLPAAEAQDLDGEAAQTGTENAAPVEDDGSSAN